MADTQNVSTGSFEERMIRRLKDSKMVEHVISSEVLDDISAEQIIKLLLTPSTIKLEDEGLVFTDEYDEKFLCPNYGLNITADGEWLSDKIPGITFDIEQGGNVRKAGEAHAAYICACVVLVLHNKTWTEEFNNTVNNYNYSEMDSVGKTVNFTKLLENWQDYQSTTINIIVSAAKYNISNLKKDAEKFLKDSIPGKEQVELRNLCDAIKDINREYSKGVLSPINVQNLTKEQILKFLGEKQLKIQSEIDASGIETLYKITTISSEYISPIKKKEILIFAESCVNEENDASNTSRNNETDPQVLIERWKRRYLKIQKISIRKTELIKYFNDKNCYVLPPKL